VWLDLTSDVRTAIRQLRRTPGTSSLIVFTLAMAIAAATIGFTFADLALFRGLPVDDASKVVSVFVSDTHGSNPRARMSAPDFLDYLARSTTLDRISAMREGRAPLIVDGQSRTLRVAYATGDLLAAMGQPAVQGRALQVGDDKPGAMPVVMLSHQYWQSEFHSRVTALGQTMQIGREHFAIVGVLTPEMEFGNLAEIDVWLPLKLSPDGPRDVRNLRLIARLKDHVDFDTAAAELAMIGDTLATEHPDVNGGWKARLIPVSDLAGGQGFWVVVALFMLSIGLLIAIATANVSNLILVRTTGRQRELAVRTALGARRGRLVRQLLTEGMMLSVVAAAFALPAAEVGLRSIGVLSPEPVFRQLRIDSHELSFVSLLVLICPLMFTVAAARSRPAPVADRTGPASGTRGSTASSRGRGALVIAQVALAVILLTVSSLALRSVATIYTVPTGMETSSALVFSLDFDDVQYPDAAAARGALLATQAALRGLSGVEVVSTLSTLPILGGESYSPVSAPDAIAVAGSSRPTAVVTGASADVGWSLGLKLLAGTWWTDGELDAIVVGRELAMRQFGGVPQAVGRMLNLTVGAGVTTWRIAGVVNDVVASDRTTVTPPRVWMPLDPTARSVWFVARTSGDPAALASGVRSVVAATAPGVPVETLQTLDAELRRAASSDYVVTGLLAGFSWLALALASTGLFGVVSYSVSQRTAEFGTRMALGASAWDVVRQVGGEASVMLGMGLALGLAGGVGVAFTMTSVLYGVSPTDASTLGLVVVVVMAATLVATALPAWRASRINPITALRAD